MKEKAAFFGTRLTTKSNSSCLSLGLSNLSCGEWLLARVTRKVGGQEWKMIGKIQEISLGEFNLNCH